MLFKEGLTPEKQFSYFSGVQFAQLSIFFTCHFLYFLLFSLRQSIAKTFKLKPYEYGIINGDVYLKIFYHNIEKGGFFDNVTQAKYNPDQNKYSILSNITDEFRDSDGKFTFAIVYPTKGIYNIWQQSNFPLDQPKYVSGKTTTTPVAGFKPIKTYANRTNVNCTWGGLTCPNYTSYLLDGCPNGPDWFFAIGYTGKGKGKGDILIAFLQIKTLLRL